MRGILFCYVFAFAGICDGQEKIAIPELLEYKTRDRALQQFVLRTDVAAGIHGWKELAKFSKDHQDIGVLASAERLTGKQLYAVTWKPVSIADEIARLPGTPNSKAGYERLLRASDAPLLSTDLEYAVFDNEGLLVPLDGALSSKVHGLVMDLNADGALEVMEEKVFESVRYVMVRQLTGQKAIFAAAYEWGELKGRGTEWGYAVRSEDGNGVYQIAFGPKLGDGVLSEAVFRWDTDRRTWGCENPGEHVRVLGLKSDGIGLSNVWEEIVALAAEGAVGKAGAGKSKR